MISKKIHKLILPVLLAWSSPLLASQQLLDPEIYKTEIDFARLQDPYRIHHPSLQSFTQNQFNEYIDSLQLFKPESDFFHQMTLNSYETPYVVFNAQVKNFFNLHNSRPLSFLQLDAKSDPFFTRANGIYAPHSFSGMGAQFYTEFFNFFSFDIKPYFLFHDDPSVTHATLKEAYGSIHFNALSLDIGKAAIHWGYGAYQPMVLSDDTNPFFMVRLRNNDEIKFEHGPLSVLGKTRFEMFYGWLDSHRRYPNGHILGSTFSFQPTDRFHFHLTQTVLMGGNFAPSNNPAIFFYENMVPGSPNKSNRNNTFGLRYRIPKIEIEPYLDVYVEDCCGSPVINPRDMLNLLGVYMPPKDSGKKFDLAVEWVRTNYITYRHEGFMYIQSQKILGHPIGPDARGIYTVGRYFYSKKLQFENMFAYEIRGKDGQAGSNTGFTSIKTIVPSYQEPETRYRLEQFISWFAKPSWKWTVHLGGERVQSLGYRTNQNKWQGIVGLESAYNF